MFERADDDEKDADAVCLADPCCTARYAFDLTAALHGFARIDAQHVGQSYPDFARSDPATFQRAYTLVDLRSGIVQGH